MPWRGPRPDNATKLARAARKKPSVAETVVWGALRGQKTGFKFRREVPVGPYRVDFYCAEARLCVELDGEQHQPERDQVRDAYLADLGLFTIRIPNRDFFYLDRTQPWPDFLSTIIATCEERAGRPAFPAED